MFLTYSLRGTSQTERVRKRRENLTGGYEKRFARRFFVRRRLYFLEEWNTVAH